MRRHRAAGLVVTSAIEILLTALLTACATSADRSNDFTPVSDENTFSLNRDDAYREVADCGADTPWKNAITVHPGQLFEET